MSNDERSIQIPGVVEVDEGVIKDMIGYIALTNYGVSGMASPSITDGIAKMLPRARLRKGIVLHNHETSVAVELYIIVQYGVNVATVAENLADTVRYALEEYLQIDVEDISVNIQGVKI